MYKQYLNQTLHLLKENKLLSMISIVGTALAISMIMVIVLAYEVKTANYEPEVNRDRTLSIRWAGVGYKSNPDWHSFGMLSLKAVKECFYTLKSPEAVTGVVPFQRKLVGMPGGTTRFNASLSYTDATFWKVFDFHFLKGTSYAQAEFESGIKKAVVAQSVARRLYGTIDVVGKTIQLNYMPYTICGVVDDVPTFAEASFAEVWIPYTTVTLSTSQFGVDGILGDYRCFILARKKSDFDKIKAEVDKSVTIFNAISEDQVLLLRGQPDTQFAQISRQWPNQDSNVSEMVAKYALIIFILLLVPAINLSGMTLSRMRKRMSEIGVRKAFGATRTELLGQVLYENFVLTILGGFLGLILSYIAIITMGEWLLNGSVISMFSSSSSLNVNMLFHIDVFVYALLFCMLLNLLSAGIPAWKASRITIVNALNEK